MNDQPVDALDKERRAIASSGRLQWFHWVIIALSLALTTAAWYFAKHQVEQEAADRFERSAAQVLDLVTERMRKYELGLLSGVAAIHTHGGDIDHENWRIFARRLHIEADYPGINGIGVIHNVPPHRLEAYLREQRRTRPDYRVHPTHDEVVHLPITYIEPSAENAKAVGLDVAHEANRYGAALKARDSGETRITRPIVLVQDSGRTPGFLFYAPFYEGGIPETLEARRRQFTGMVYAPFVFHKLMEGVLQKEKRDVRLRVSDTADVLYDETLEDDPELDQSPIFSTTRHLDLYGQTWTFDIVTTRSFRHTAANAQPIFVLIGGLIIEALLLALFFALARANRRAVAFADRTSSELRDRTRALEISNAELEKFAYVTSHDLKTPLRGISDLTEYLEEDLEPYLTGTDVNPDIPNNLERLRQQTRRMSGLINGILDYSSVGAEPPIHGIFDPSVVVSRLRADLHLRADQIKIEGSLPVLNTDELRFAQVMVNLIGNAVKYHHDPENAVVTVRAEERGDFYAFSIEDNGPGIDPRFHKRIFDVFQTLQPRDDVESTGIGLSIVKKAVESHGGYVSIVSDVGQGAVFTFEWPKDLEHQQQKAA